MTQLPGRVLLFACVIISALAFVPLSTRETRSRPDSLLCMQQQHQQQQQQQQQQTFLFDPKERDAHYKGNIAQYLVDLHDAKATFDFCGGMMFQLVLTDALRDHLGRVAAAGAYDTNNNSSQQPVVFDATKPRMHMTAGYTQTSNADNIHYFHGREIRRVPAAAGGMGMVLQLSLASSSDPEGWTPQEQKRYDGWGHDSGREWRKGSHLEEEGFVSFREKFGPSAFSLHHRFYLHKDVFNRLWLSAEDGCEGTPASKPVASLSNLFGLL